MPRILWIRIFGGLAGTAYASAKLSIRRSILDQTFGVRYHGIR